jgi:hypothetical protein
MAFVAFGLVACGDDSSSTVTDKETEVKTVTDEEQAPAPAEPTPAPAEPTSTSAAPKDCPPGQIPVIATGGCAKE